MKTLRLSAIIVLAAQALFAAPVKITDVFANTSWRQKKLIVETEIESTDAEPRKVKLDIVVKDPDGKVVKKKSLDVDVKKGLTTVKPEIPWKDPITWEIGRGYMYTMEVRADGEITFKPFRFGFREVWRDGKEIYMNGHIQRFRTCYHYYSNTNGVDFLHDIGYNTIHLSHRIDPDPKENIDYLYHLSEKGMATMLGTASFTRGRGASNPTLIAKNQRRYRNIPACVAFYFGVNVQCPQWDKDPRWIGDGHLDWFSDLHKAGKANNPNVLFFSHGDGSCCDLATGNLYLNFTPLQEREDWLRKWANPGSGDYPYQACEFGHPFCWVWGKPGFAAYTEYYAMYFGDDVYTEESEPFRLMRRKIYIRRVQFPYYWKFHEMFTWRTFRSWRTYGLNGGVVPFNLEEGYGMPGWDWKYNLYNKYGVNYNLKEPVKGRPDWAWPSYDYYQLGNKDFLGYIAGCPDHTDKRHAYWSGEKVSKNAVFIWDYFEPQTFTAQWKVEMEGKTVASGKLKEKCEIGPILLKEFSFTAPTVAKKTPAKMTLVYRDAKGAEVFTDTFDLEFYPAYAREWAKAPECWLVDPKGESEKMLAELGVPNVKKVKSCFEIPETATHIIIGRMALSETPLALSPEAIEKGQKVLILPQMPKSWQRMGFTVEDTMSRCMFPRDSVSPAYKDITKDMLHDWDGQTFYGDNTWTDAKGEVHSFGNICWNGARGPRWTRRMVVSGVPFRMPTTVGFLPLIDGEFDMNYAGLMVFHAKKGSITFCQLDFEGRVKTDPAATLVADAVFAGDFLGTDAPDHSRKVYAAGKAAAQLLETLRQPFTALKAGALPPPDSVCVVSPDATFTKANALAAAKDGARILFYCNTKMAKEFGIKTEQRIDVYRVKHDKENPLLRGIGPANLRWRDFFDYPAFVGSNLKGWKFDMDGMMAYGRVGEGRIVFCQLDPTLFRRRMFAWEDPDSPLLPTIQVDLATTLAAYTNKYEGVHIGGTNDTLHMAVEGRVWADKVARETVMPVKIEGRDWQNRDSSVERIYQFWARLLTNLGADPGDDALRRMLWAKDLRQKFDALPRPMVLGRLAVGTAEEPDAKNCLAEFNKVLPTEKDAIAGKVKAGTEVTGPNGTKAQWDDSKMEYRTDGTACLWKTAYGGDWAGWSVDLLMYEFDVPKDEGRRLKFYTKCPYMRMWLNGKELEKEVMEAPEFERALDVKPGRNILTIKALSHKGVDRDLIRATFQITDANGRPFMPANRAGAVGFAAAPRPKVLSAYNVGELSLNDVAKVKELFKTKIPTEDEVFADKADFTKSVTLPDGKDISWDADKMDYWGDGTACIWKTPAAGAWKGWSLILLAYEFDVPEGEGRSISFYSKSPAVRVSLNGKDLDGATKDAPAEAPSFSRVIPVKTGRNTIVVKAITHAGSDRDLIRVQFCRLDAKGRPFTETCIPEEIVKNLTPEEAERMYIPEVDSSVRGKVFYGPFRRFDAYDWHQY